MPRINVFSVHVKPSVPVIINRWKRRKRNNNDPSPDRRFSAALRKRMRLKHRIMATQHFFAIE
jgi:hypothetical protein